MIYRSARVKAKEYTYRMGYESMKSFDLALYILIVFS